jgi:thiol-disulfide isomerase/thioredoxin
VIGVRTRWIALAAGVVLVAFTVLLAAAHREEPSIPRLVREHRAVPEFRVTTLAGRVIDRASLDGKAYVVNVFNSWCIPCRQELPALKAFYDAHRGERDFEMIGIVRDDDEAAIRGFVAAEDIGWPVAFEGAEQALLDFGTTGQPETYVVAPDGVAVCGALGPSTLEALELWLAAARSGRQCT